MSSAIGVAVIGRNEGERVAWPELVGARRERLYVDSAHRCFLRANGTGAGVEVVALDMSRPFTAARARNEGFACLQRLQPDIHFVQFVDGDCEVQADGIVKGLKQPDWPIDNWQALHRLALLLCRHCTAQAPAARAR